MDTIMKYFRLSADWSRVSLVDVNGDSVSLDSAGLSDQLAGKIKEWNGRYEYIIQLDVQQRSEIREAIKSLDVEGFELCDDIKSETGSKVEYYSEGLLKKLVKLPSGDLV